MPYISPRQKNGIFAEFRAFSSRVYRNSGRWIARTIYIVGVSRIDINPTKMGRGTYTYEHACLHQDDDCEKMTTPTTLRDVGTSAKVKAAQVS